MLLLVESGALRDVVAARGIVLLLIERAISTVIWNVYLDTALSILSISRNVAQARRLHQVALAVLEVRLRVNHRQALPTRLLACPVRRSQLVVLQRQHRGLQRWKQLVIVNSNRTGLGGIGCPYR